MPERDANQLAADVTPERVVLAKCIGALQGLAEGNPKWEAILTKHDIPVNEATEALHAVFAEHDRLVGLVGTLQQERDDIQARLLVAYENEGVAEVFAYAAGCVERECERREAAEAALAEARQALAEIERMAGAAGPGETPAAPLASIARRALAATERAT